MSDEKFDRKVSIILEEISNFGLNRMAKRDWTPLSRKKFDLRVGVKSVKCEVKRMK